MSLCQFLLLHGLVTLHKFAGQHFNSNGDITPSCFVCFSTCTCFYLFVTVLPTQSLYMPIRLSSRFSNTENFLRDCTTQLSRLKRPEHIRCPSAPAYTTSLLSYLPLVRSCFHSLHAILIPSHLLLVLAKRSNHFASFTAYRVASLLSNFWATSSA